ncbi:MAG: ATP phosphoribosyltransferase [Deltaproteobacteria bacterium]|nr:ATP phosphoribosyltransferase [Deltaproteobacteria bacterium]
MVPNPEITPPSLRVALPKGRMYEGVVKLLAGAGIELRASGRSYRPTLNLEDAEVKLLKPQNIVEMLHMGSRDVGFAGADWAAELNADLHEVLDIGLDPVRVVAAAPIAFLEGGALPDKPMVVVSEYEQLTKAWIARRGLDATFLRAYGATEVFPPEDADVIVDNTATGSTLVANKLQIVDTVMTSSTRLYASRQAMADPSRRTRIEDLALLLRAVLAARTRVLIEVNVSAESLPKLLEIVPSMREPTVSKLASGGGFAVKAAVPRNELPVLIPRLKAAGGSDVIVTALAQIVV